MRYMKSINNLCSYSGFCKKLFKDLESDDEKKFSLELDMNEMVNFDWGPVLIRKVFVKLFHRNLKLKKAVMDFSKILK